MLCKRTIFEIDRERKNNKHCSISVVVVVVAVFLFCLYKQKRMKFHMMIIAFMQNKQRKLIVV